MLETRHGQVRIMQMASAGIAQPQGLLRTMDVGLSSLYEEPALDLKLLSLRSRAEAE